MDKKAEGLRRLDRLKRLRAMRAPRWVVRSEQVALALARRGLKHYGIGSRTSKAQDELYLKFVVPALEA